MAKEQHSRPAEVKGWRGTVLHVAALAELVIKELGSPTNLTIKISDATGLEQQFQDPDSLRAAAADIDAANVTSIEITGQHRVPTDPATYDYEYISANAWHVNKLPRSPGLSLRTLSPAANRAVGMMAVVEEAARRRVDPRYRERAFRPFGHRAASFALVNAEGEHPGPTLKRRAWEEIVTRGPTAVVTAVIVLVLKHFL